MNISTAATAGSRTPGQTVGWGTGALLVVLILTCSIAFSLPYADPDLWGHVQYGRDLLAYGLPETATYSFTARDHRWINHENLSELLLALGADTLGPAGLLIVKCQLGALVIGLMAVGAYRRGAGLLSICVVAALVSINLAPFWQLRPHVLSYFLFALLIGSLDWTFVGWEGPWWLPWSRRRSGTADSSVTFSFDSGRLHRLWLVAILFVFWTNTHGGFVAGLCVYVLYLTCRAGEASLACGLRPTRIAGALLLMAAIAVAATLLNPYGLRLHAWLISSLRVPRPEITEWHPLSAQSEVFWPFVSLAGLTVIALVASRRSLDTTQLAVLSVVALQAVLHERHVPFFAILVGFWLPVHVHSFLERVGISGAGDDADQNPTAAMRALLLAGMGVVMFLISGLLASRLGHVWVSRDAYPVSAVQYMADHNMSGRLVVTYNWAQYVIAAFGHRDGSERGIEVAFDGRFRTCYPQHIVDQHFDFILGTNSVPRYRGANSPPADGSRVLRDGRPDLVLISRLQEHSVHVMHQNAEDWVLLYQDSLAQLWGRRSKYDEPTHACFIPPESRVISDRPQFGWAVWPALPQKVGSGGELANRPVDRRSEVEPSTGVHENRNLDPFNRVSASRSHGAGI